MDLVKLEFEIESLKRDQKEVRIKNYFKSFADNAPNFVNFSFTSPSSIADYEMKYIGAISLLTEFNQDKDKKGKTKKERSFFFIFLKGNSKRFDHQVFTNELFEVCGFFARTTIITIVFLFENESIQLKYGSETGKFSRISKNVEELLFPSLNFIKSPDEFISKLIDRRKYLLDCYQAFSNNEKSKLPFIETDYLNTRQVFLNIIQSLTSGKKAIIVEGPAGAGKTILALRLLGFYKNSDLLIINEYFENELSSIFKEMNETDIRFFNHRGKNSTELIRILNECKKNQIPARKYFDFFTKFIYKKYWKDKNRIGKPDKNFWLEFVDTSRPNWSEDFKEFKTSYLNNTNSNPSDGERIFIVDEGQRVYDETLEEAITNGFFIVIFGDLQQKLNPETDNLRLYPDDQSAEQDLENSFLNNLRNNPSVEFIKMKYPIRIPEPALEKIKFILGIINERSQHFDKDVYPIKFFDTCESFVSGFKADKTSQKFYSSYQDMWRHEKDSSSEGASFSRKVKKVSILSHCVGFDFEDGFSAYPPTNLANEISDFYGKKIKEMEGLTLEVIIDPIKEKRYRIMIKKEGNKIDKDEYYGLSEISKLNPEIKTISKVESEKDKNKLLIDPKYKTKIFTPYELISREVRNIYLFIPKTITIEKGIIIDNGFKGHRFMDKTTNTNYLLNQLYVIMTRATNKIFIYCENKILNDYLKSRLYRYLELKVGEKTEFL